jgi:sugar transferase (PEP-CTERM/EpsH1 system associated)
MRLLYLAQRVPYPPDRGDKITTYHQVRHLARHHEVSVACLADGPGDLRNAEALAPLVASVDAVPLSRPHARLRALTAIATGAPLTVAYFNERRLHERVAGLVRSRKFDGVMLYSSGVAQFVEPFAEIPRVMNFADLDSLKWRLYAEFSPAPTRWVYRMESRRLLDYERKIAMTFAHSLLSAPREVEDFKRLIPGAPVSCLENGVDLEYFKPTHVPKQRDSLVFAGVMDYFPNVDGVRWFCREVLPRVQERFPGATLTICGARPVRAVTELGRLRGVTVTGGVPDVRPYLSAAGVCVVPLRLARGVQNKLLQAMAMGLPTVATSAAFGGINGAPGEELLIADDPDSFAACVVRLLADEALRDLVGRSARAAAERNYRWDVSLDRLDALLESLVVKRAPGTHGLLVDPPQALLAPAGAGDRGTGARG